MLLRANIYYSNSNCTILLYPDGTPPLYIQATLSLIDSGVERRDVPFDNLLQLPSPVHPSNIAPLATPCSLHGIECINEGEGWFPLDIQLLWKHLYHKKVCGRVGDRDGRSERGECDKRHGEWRVEEVKERSRKEGEGGWNS